MKTWTHEILSLSTINTTIFVYKQHGPLVGEKVTFEGLKIVREDLHIKDRQLDKR